MENGNGGWRRWLLVTLMGVSLSAAAVHSAIADQHMSKMMPVERSKILKDAGVYGVFSLFKLDREWAALNARAKKAAVAEVEAVIEKHKAHVVVDAYLTRGLSESADFFLRSHAYELAAIQTLVVEIMATKLGRYATLTDSFVGVTKALNYAPQAPDLLKQLKAASYMGDPPKYVIVIPTKKNAAWWNLPPNRRLAEMVAHTVPTLEFLTNVKRKLYHASGLDDLDFITYFETNDLVAFNNLVISLLSVPENTYNVQMGNPTVLGTIHSIDEVLKALSE